MRRVASSSQRVIPESIKEMDIWVVWNMDDKTPLAPWNHGHMFPATWAEGMLDDPSVDVERRPERAFEKARMIAEMHPTEIHATFAFPPKSCPVNSNCDGCLDCADNGPKIPDEVRPTLLLPHNPSGERLMQVDFDDVRDPESGEVTDEVWEIVERLDSYTEVSSSGTGLHVFVYAELPGRLEKFLADLGTQGGIELYDHGRFVGATWDHVEGTPESVKDCQSEVEALVEEYETDEQQERREGPDKSFSEKRAEAERSLDASVTPNSGGSSGHNAYYALNATDVAEADSTYRQYGSRGQGPHPAHGGTNHADNESTNFQVSDSGAWNCFVPGHGGGGALELIAVMGGVCRCQDAQRGFLKSNPRKLLKTCLLARDKYAGGSLDGEKPPYMALVGVGREMDLVFDDADETDLSSDALHLARKVFDSMSASDVSTGGDE